MLLHSHSVLTDKKHASSCKIVAYNINKNLTKNLLQNIIWCDACLMKYDVKQLLEYQLLIGSAKFRIYCQLRIHYIVHDSRLLVPVLSMTNLSHACPFYFFKVHFSIIFPSNLGLPSPFFRQAWPPTLRTHFYSPPRKTHTLTFSFPSICLS